MKRAVIKSWRVTFQLSLPNFSKTRLYLIGATLFVTTSNARMALFVVLSLIVSAEVNPALNLYIIERDDAYGFSDKSGKPVIPPR